MPGLTREKLAFGAAAVFAAAALAGCGGGSEPAQPGSKAAPLQGRENVKGTGDHGTKPAPHEGEPSQGATARVAEGLSPVQAKASAPCGLVTRAEARQIFGRAALAPSEAPQGPKCIYRTQRPGGFVTLAVQAIDYKKASAVIRDRRRVTVTGRNGVCGTLGQSLLYVAVGDGRVLSVTGPCKQAARFASKALPRIGG